MIGHRAATHALQPHMLEQTSIDQPVLSTAVRRARPENPCPPNTRHGDRYRTRPPRPCVPRNDGAQGRRSFLQGATWVTGVRSSFLNPGPFPILGNSKPRWGGMKIGHRSSAAIVEPCSVKCALSYV